MDLDVPASTMVAFTEKDIYQITAVLSHVWAKQGLPDSVEQCVKDTEEIVKFVMGNFD